MRPTRRSSINARIEEIERRAQERGCPDCRSDGKVAEFDEAARLEAIAAITGQAVEEPEPARCPRCGRRLGGRVQVRLRVVDGYGALGLASETPPDSDSPEDSDDW